MVTSVNRVYRQIGYRAVGRGVQQSEPLKKCKLKPYYDDGEQQLETLKLK